MVTFVQAIIFSSHANSVSMPTSCDFALPARNSQVDIRMRDSACELALPLVSMHVSGLVAGDVTLVKNGDKLPWEKIVHGSKASYVGSI